MRSVRVTGFRRARGDPDGGEIRLIDLLMQTGLRRMEVTSFVRPDVIPQLADATVVLEGIDRVDGVC